VTIRITSHAVKLILLTVLVLFVLSVIFPIAGQSHGRPDTGNRLSTPRGRP
jgi:hypothetical protein